MKDAPVGGSFDWAVTAEFPQNTPVECASDQRMRKESLDSMANWNSIRLYILTLPAELYTISFP